MMGAEPLGIYQSPQMPFTRSMMPSTARRMQDTAYIAACIAPVTISAAPKVKEAERTE